MQAIKLTDKVWWVGAIDWGIRDFHGYSTSRGTTYNAYLILADKVTLIDTVKAPFKDEMMARISSVVDPEKIRYIISNHSEMDHSGCLSEVINLIGPEVIFASANGVRALNEHFRLKREITPVKDGETISLGDMTVTCMETRMFHWPDSMITYLNEGQILFSQDGFGMHLASEKRFSNEIDENILYHEASKYYANILTPFSMFVKKAIDRIEKSGLELKMVAPDHGPMWRTETDKIISWYKKWVEQKPTNKAVVIYDTMWKSTEKMASAIADGITSSGAIPKIMPLRTTHRSDVAVELLEAGALVVGSPTINNEIFPTVADVLVYLRGLKFQNLIGTSFGSFGWSGESLKHLNNYLNEMGIKLVSTGINVKYVPRETDLDNCRALGREVGTKLQT